MRWLSAVLGSLIVGLLPSVSSAQARWIESQHYFVIRPAQRTSVPAGKVEVAEAFSYGCPACYTFNPIAKQIEKRLPANAAFVYQHASFNEGESWPLFQRAYLAAQALGVDKKGHDALYEAIWKTGELAVIDEKTRRLKNPQPTMEKVAKFYARTTGVAEDKFLGATKSFGVETAIQRTEAWLRGARIDSTPSIVVNGKYRVTVQSAGSVNEMLALIDYLVAQESGAKQ